MTRDTRSTLVLASILMWAAVCTMLLSLTETGTTLMSTPYWTAYYWLSTIGAFLLFRLRLSENVNLLADLIIALTLGWSCWPLFVCWFVKTRHRS